MLISLLCRTKVSVVPRVDMGMHAVFMRRFRVILALAVILTISVFLPTSPSSALSNVPAYEMPFPCGEAWNAATYDGHSSNDNALDFNSANDLGKPVLASASGSVSVADGVYDINASEDDYGGRNVVIDHGGGHSTYYGHLDQVDVVVGQNVQRGDRIGTVGNTGHTGNPRVPVAAHLHYEQRVNGTASVIVFSGAAAQYSYYPVLVSMTSANCGGGNGGLPDAQVVHNLDIPGVHYVAAGGRLFWYDSSLHSAFVNQMHIKLGTNRQIRNMYNSEINLIEANRTNGGTFLARSHMPPDNTFLYEWREIEPEKAPQYVLQYSYAFEITSGEVAFLNGTNKATMIPPGNIQYWLASYNAMPDIGPGRLLKSATSPDFYEVQGGYLYHANNMTVVDCLAAGYKVQNGVPSAYQPVPLTLIQAFLNNGRNAYQLATCQMPDDVVFFGTGGAERWQITGSNPYARRQYASTLAIHCYRGPSPTLREISGGGVNAAAEGAQIHCPNNTYLRNTHTGQVFQWWDGQLHYISSQEMLSCLTQGNTGVVIPLPEAAFGGAPQGAPAQCQFEGKLLQAPNGQVFWVKDGARRYVGNAQILNCLTVRANAGVPVPVPVETVNSYTLGAGAYCTYPADIRFVRGDGQAEVWRVFTNGTRQHAGSLCSPQTDPRYAVHVVPAGEVDGHAHIGMFDATPSACAAIP